MVPLQARAALVSGLRSFMLDLLTELLLDHLQDLLLIELLWKALNSCQCLTTIALCHIGQSLLKQIVTSSLTLNTDVDVLLSLLCLPGMFIGLREGV